MSDIDQLTNIQTAKIMIVDDDPINIKVIVKFLRKAGFRHVWQTQDSRQALALYQESAPDIVILDLVMPHLDGFDVIEQIKATEPGGYSPILVMSGDISQETRLKALQSGAKDFIGKPFNHHEAMARIRNMIEIRRLHQKIQLQNTVLNEQNRRLLHGMQTLQHYARRLQATEAHFRNLYERAPLAYQLLDTDGNLLEVNQAWEALFGRNRKEVRGVFFGNLLEAPDRPLLEALFTDFKQAGYLDSPAFAAINQKTAEHIHIEIKGVIDYDEQGHFIQAHCNIVDITARTKAEAAREALLNQLRISASVFESTRDGIVITDPRRRIIDVNPAFTEITGYKRAEVLGRDPGFLASGMTPRTVFRDLWKTIDQQGFWRGELINRRKDGEVYAENVTITAVKTASDALNHYVAVINSMNPLRNDILTGLPSRHVLNDRLARAIQTARLNGRKVALMIAGIDRFKAVNEALGHTFGDLLLREVGRRLQHCLPGIATLARLRGDEFTIILSDLEDITPVENQAQLIMNIAAQAYTIDHESVRISLSLGVAIYPDDTQDIDHLFRNADLAMHAAKAQGGACCHYFMVDMQAAALEQKRLHDHLHQACTHNQFFLLYQPIIDLKTGVIRKAEALIRWQHPERGLVSPACFIPLAEKTGLIVQIGSWIIQEAVACVRIFRQHRTDFQLSVNVSPVQLMDEQFNVVHYSNLLNQLGVPGSALVLEITEGFFLEGNDRVQQQLSACRVNDIQLAIDDFGTGYSALSYLTKFHVDYIKIDQSFVRTLEPESKLFALCEAIIVMAHKLGFKVIAEGIETVQQRILLTDMGCDFGQGYLIARPIPADDLEIMLKSSFSLN